MKETIINLRSVSYLLIFLPIVMGVFRIRRLNKTHRVFLIYLLLTAILETLAHNYPFPMNRVTGFVSLVTSHPVLLFSLLSYLIPLYAIRLSLVFFLANSTLVFIDIWSGNLLKYTVPHGIFFSYTILCFVAIFCFIKINEERGFFKYKATNLLIIIPTFIELIYFLILMIMMNFLYSPQTKATFLGLFGVVRTLNAIKYVSYFVAFLIYPPQEEFIK